MSAFKPMLAAEADLAKLRYPLFASPKLDGIRCTVYTNEVLTRSLKQIPNRFINGALKHRAFEGFDGELIVGEPAAKDCYTQSVSGVMRKEGEPAFKFHVFDHVLEPAAPYYARQAKIEHRIEDIGSEAIVLHTQEVIWNEAELIAHEAKLLDLGYEGLILRDPNSPYKFGRSTTNEGYLLKLKRFKDSEATIIGFEEQMHNGNEATKNELGRTKRSTAKAGLTGKDTLGALIVRDVVTGVEFNIGTGFDDAERARIWAKRDSMQGKLTKYKYFPVGVKDAPRHPVYLGLRDKRDI